MLKDKNNSSSCQSPSRRVVINEEIIQDNDYDFSEPNNRFKSALRKPV